MGANIFREYDIRGIVGSQLSAETVAVIARAVGTFFVQHRVPRVSLGYDARKSSPRFAELMRDGLNSCGVDVLLIGRVPTPVLYYTLYENDVAGGVMITGSHNPPDHNGFKICLGKQALFGSQIQEIRGIAEAGEFDTGSGAVESAEVMEEYRRDVLSRISVGERPLKVVIDSGNGMGAVTAAPVYKALGVDLVELYSEPDPNFPHHHPDPTVEENLSDLIESVRWNKADVGIAFDGDGDRIGVVDENGRILWGDELMVIYSREVLREHPGATIIAEVKCSQTLFDDIAAHGGKPLMWKAGHSLIKAKMKETGAVLAGEMSGHMFFADRFYGFDDACYAGARLLEILSKTDKPLSKLIADLPKTYSTPELRVECPDERKFDVVAAIAEHFSKDHEVITIDGARIKFNHGWGLVRASNTQALLVLRFEAESQEHLEEIEETIGNMLLDIEGAVPLREAVDAARASRNDFALAIALRELGEFERRTPVTQRLALRDYAGSVALLRSLDQPLTLAHTIRHLAQVHEGAGQFDEAEKNFDEALALYREHSIEDDLNFANAVRYSASIKERLGRTEEAAELWQEAERRYRDCGIQAGVNEAAKRREKLQGI
ncbi:MAG: tetratricopeptide repeat protein [Pyrinomonadaceae bacterium]